MKAAKAAKAAVARGAQAEVGRAAAWGQVGPVVRALRPAAEEVRAARAAMAAVGRRAVCGVLLDVGYVGTGYAGFTPQRDQRTVGGELLRVLQRLDEGVLGLRVASRTDAGVHARTQRVAFDATRPLPNKAWVRGTVPRLPTNIVVRSAATVAIGFQPRFGTIAKRYRYELLCGSFPDPFFADRCWYLGRVPDAFEQALRAELPALVGTHDFAAFRSSADRREVTVRTLQEASLHRLTDRPRRLAIDVAGDAFLHNMVRIIVGTAVDVARGRLAPGTIARALVSGNRADAGVTAPPHGLYLEHLALRDEGAERWPPREGSDP